jgi:PAS domain S-box-containing protein
MLKSGHTEIRWIARMILCLLLLAFSSALLRAARPYTPVHPDPVLDKWRWRSYPELEGLGVRCMAEDKDGSMWFGVDDGVRQYDGLTWTAYTQDDGILGAPVDALCATLDGGLYAGTRLGISEFDGERWTGLFPVSGAPPCPVYALAEASTGGLWAATCWGAANLTSTQTTIYTTKDLSESFKKALPEVSTVIVPHENAPARSWPEGIGVRVENGVVVAAAPAGPGALGGVGLLDRIVAVDGQPWVSQSRLDGPAGTSVRLSVRRGDQLEQEEVTLRRGHVQGSYADFTVFDICESRDGSVWLGMYGGEILHGDAARPSVPDGHGAPARIASWRLYTAQDGLDVGWRPHILETRSGEIWVASEHAFKGLNRFDGSHWSRFSLADVGGSDLNLSILQTTDGALWVGGNGGYLYGRRPPRGDGGNPPGWRGYSAPDVPLPPTGLVDLLESRDGALWIVGAGQEVVRLDYDTLRWTTHQGLRFQCETADGSLWFVARADGLVVRHDPSAQTWRAFGVGDGLMDSPRGLIVTRRGQVWAAGGHDSTAATALLDGEEWRLRMHPRLSWQIDGRAIYESSDGAVWFGAAANSDPGRGQFGGVVRFGPPRGTSGPAVWTHYRPPEALLYTYGIAQTGDGDMWFGGHSRQGLCRFDGTNWSHITQPGELAPGQRVDVVYAGLNGDLWVGTRDYGVFHYDCATWTRHTVEDGLRDNRVKSILQTDDRTVWAVTARGVSRFDGRTWTTHALPADLLRARLRQSRDGSLWMRDTRCRTDPGPPETAITLSVGEVSQPGNTPVSWKGTDPWRVTEDEDLQYSWRLDDGKWSPYSFSTSHIFLALPGGDHTFEVRARDQDFNVDLTPATVRFRVVPPVWQQAWFIGMVVLFAAGIAVQTGRVVRRGRRLRAANRQVRDANERLEQRVSERTSQLSESNRMLKTLSECNQALIREEDEPKLIEAVCRILVEDGGFRMAWVGLAEEDDGKTVRPAGHWGHEAGYLDALDLTWADTEKGGGPTGVAIRKGKTVTVQDISTDPHYGPWRAAAVAQGYASSIGLPLRSRDRVLGALRIYAGEPDAFSEDEVRLLEELADDLAFGLTALRMREDHRRVEEAVREGEARYRKVIDLANGVAYERDWINGTFTFVDEGIEHLTGYRASEVTPQGLKTLIRETIPHTSRDTPVEDEKGRRASGAYIADYRLQTRDGRTVWVADAAVRRHDASGRLVSTLGILQDITERKQAEEELSTHHERLEQLVAERTEELEAEAAKLAESGKALTYLLEDVNEARKALEEANARLQAANTGLDEFAYVVSHDLKAPLRGVSQLADWLSADCADALGDEGRKMISLMVGRVKRLYSLIDAILEYSKIGRVGGRREQVDVHELVEEITDALALPENIDVAIQGRLPTVTGDRTRIEQVWMNLVTNAAKFMDKSEGRIEIGCVDEGTHWTFSVEDNGVGIEQRYHAKIFRIFQSLAPHDGLESTGIGLTLVKKIVEFQGGEIRVESEVGKGSKFLFTVPKEGTTQ